MQQSNVFAVKWAQSYQVLAHREWLHLQHLTCTVADRWVIYRLSLSTVMWFINLVEIFDDTVHCV